MNANNEEHLDEEYRSGSRGESEVGTGVARLPSRASSGSGGDESEEELGRSSRGTRRLLSFFRGGRSARRNTRHSRTSSFSPTPPNRATTGASPPNVANDANIKTEMAVLRNSARNYQESASTIQPGAIHMPGLATATNTSRASMPNRGLQDRAPNTPLRASMPALPVASAVSVSVSLVLDGQGTENDEMMAMRLMMEEKDNRVQELERELEELRNSVSSAVVAEPLASSQTANLANGDGCMDRKMTVAEQHAMRILLAGGKKKKQERRPRQDSASPKPRRFWPRSNN